MRGLIHVIAILGLCFIGLHGGRVIAGKPQFQGIRETGPVARTGFEDLLGDGSDATGFRVGAAHFSGGVAGTRRFIQGYHRGKFAFITAGQLGVVSRIDFEPSAFNVVHFWGKDIRELTPDGRGVLVVKHRFLPFERRIPLTDRYRPYTFLNVEQIRVESQDEESRGVHNLDTFQVVSVPF